jgi:hypothetical protein
MKDLKIRPLICLPDLTDTGKVKLVHNSPACQMPINLDRECAEKLFDELAAVLQRTGTA